MCPTLEFSAAAGLENIFLLTSRKKNQLRMDMSDWDGDQASASYSSFSIDHEDAGYQLRLGTFTGGSAGRKCSAFERIIFGTFGL